MCLCQVKMLQVLWNGGSSSINVDILHFVPSRNGVSVPNEKKISPCCLEIVTHPHDHSSMKLHDPRIGKSSRKKENIRNYFNY